MGLGRRTFAPGEVLTASNVMNYLMDQSVMSFAGTAARGSAIGTAVAEGMVTYLADSNTIETYSGTRWERQTGGLVPLSPPTVTAVSGSATVSPLGVVSFTSCTDIQLDGIFSSNYKNYQIQITVEPSTTAVLKARLCASGTPYTSGNYSYQGWWSYGTSALGKYQATSASSFDLSEIANGVSGANNAIATIMNPMVATRTTMTVLANGFYSGAYFGNGTSQILADLGQFDGFRIFPSSGNMTGTIQIFGFRDK